MNDALLFLKDHGKAIGAGITAGATAVLAGGDVLGVLAAIASATGIVNYAPYQPTTARARDRLRR